MPLLQEINEKILKFIHLFNCFAEFMDIAKLTRTYSFKYFFYLEQLLDLINITLY
jgi:hypothetical protein